MAHINHFLIYVLGSKTFPILEVCCNLLCGYGKYFFLHNNSISLTKVWNKWKLCGYFLQADVKLFLLSTATFCNWKLSLEILLSEGSLLPSKQCPFHAPWEAQLSHWTPGTVSKFSPVNLRKVSQWLEDAGGRWGWDLQFDHTPGKYDSVSNGNKLSTSLWDSFIIKR